MAENATNAGGSRRRLVCAGRDIFGFLVFHIYYGDVHLGTSYCTAEAFWGTGAVCHV